VSTPSQVWHGESTVEGELKPRCKTASPNSSKKELNWGVTVGRQLLVFRSFGARVTALRLVVTDQTSMSDSAISQKATISLG
jgi:hypothetical protein